LGLDLRGGVSCLGLLDWLTKGVEVWRSCLIFLLAWLALLPGGLGLLIRLFGLLARLLPCLLFCLLHPSVLSD
jgi:hypothetical protein